MGQSKTKQLKAPEQYYPEYPDLADWESQFLLKHQFLPVEVRELDSDTKRRYIVKLSDTLCAYLLERGADAYQLLMMDEPSIALAASNIMEFGETLLREGADINRMLAMDQRQIAQATLYVLEGTATPLLKNGMDVNRLFDMDERSVAKAALYVLEGTIMPLLKNGADINQLIDLDERQVARAALYFIDGRGQLLSQCGMPVSQIIVMDEQSLADALIVIYNHEVQVLLKRGMHFKDIRKLSQYKLSEYVQATSLEDSKKLIKLGIDVHTLVAMSQEDIQHLVRKLETTPAKQLMELGVSVMQIKEIDDANLALAAETLIARSGQNLLKAGFDAVVIVSMSQDKRQKLNNRLYDPNIQNLVTLGFNKVFLLQQPDRVVQEHAKALRYFTDVHSIRILSSQGVTPDTVIALGRHSLHSAVSALQRHASLLQEGLDPNQLLLSTPQLLSSLTPKLRNPTYTALLPYHLPIERLCEDGTQQAQEWLVKLQTESAKILLANGISASDILDMEQTHMLVCAQRLTSDTGKALITIGIATETVIALSDQDRYAYSLRFQSPETCGLLAFFNAGEIMAMDDRTLQTMCFNLKFNSHLWTRSLLFMPHVGSVYPTPEQIKQILLQINQQARSASMSEEDSQQYGRISLVPREPTSPPVLDEQTQQILRNCRLDAEDSSALNLEKALRKLAAVARYEDLQYLLETHRNIIDVNAKDDGTHQRSALHWLVIQATDHQYRHRSQQCIELLLSHHANDTVQDVHGKRPSDYLLDDMQEIAALFPNRKMRSKVTVPSLPVHEDYHEATVRTVVNQPQLSPRTQTLFSGLGDGVPLQQFVKHLKSLPSDRVNTQNAGKRGDTPLMLLLRNQSLSPLKKTKAKALIQYGALWQATNRRGETAEQLLAEHPERERLNAFFRP